MEIEKLYVEIGKNLESSQGVFKKTSLADDSEDIRPLLEANLILQSLKSITLAADALFKKHPSLESVFEKQYGKFSELKNREAIIETCFLEEFLFPESEEFPLLPEQEVTAELLGNYQLSFADWVQEEDAKHTDTQQLILQKFEPNIKQAQLRCSCNKCIADFRAKLRDTIFKTQVELIDKAAVELEDLMLENSISFISDYVHKLKKRIEKNNGQVRYRLKRGSLNKLESDVKAHFKRKFGYRTELGKIYKERLLSYFNGLLADDGHSPGIITEDEYERFFTQLNINIWKNPSILKREYNKLVKAVLAFKRKDISATILREYLGQFWIHSVARRKTRHFIYHMGPTNSGKTYNAIEALSKANNGCYLAPLRLLASELFDTLNEKGAKTTLLTGEEVVEIEGATHFSSTIEMARLNDEFECVVIDEIQMITDTQRGWAWTRALVNMNADEVHLCGDHSVLELVEQILKLTGDTLEIKNYDRKTKLTVLPSPIKLVDMEKNDALIVFSRRNALKYKMDLENLNFKVSIVYGRLSPEVRREQARKFDEGETDIIVATDAIAMGMNLPIKRIIFSAVAKFWDGKEFPLTPSELKQIAGRAGRFQRFPEGFVTTLQKVEDGIDVVSEALNQELSQKEFAMVGPDLDIFRSVNLALEENKLTTLSLSEFLRLFNTMTFEKPFYCVDLKEMIEVAEIVEEADTTDILSDAEIFGFACAPVNMGLVEHVQYYVWILNHYVGSNDILNEPVDASSDDIDYLETAIKCVELYQWLARHFDNKNFSYEQEALLHNKSLAIEKLNVLLSEKTSKKCSSCAAKLDDNHAFNICETCFSQRRSRRRGPGGGGKSFERNGPRRSREKKTAVDSEKTFSKKSKRSKKSKKVKKTKADSFRKG